MFSQGDFRGYNEYIGLGIGLTLVKSLVVMHGGTIGVTSDEENQGSTFTIRLPIQRAGKTAKAPEPRPEGDPGGHRVLVVDDNQTAAMLLSRVVESMGNEVRTVFGGEEAVKVVEEFRPDIVLLDLGMPKMNGYKVARHIRNETWGKDITLVALTGWGQEHDKQKTQAAGFDAHLVKPADRAALEAVLSGQSKAFR